MQRARPIKKSAQSTTALRSGPHCARAHPRVRCCSEGRVSMGTAAGDGLGAPPPRSPETCSCGWMQSSGLGSPMSLPRLGVLSCVLGPAVPPSHRVRQRLALRDKAPSTLRGHLCPARPHFPCPPPSSCEPMPINRRSGNGWEHRVWGAEGSLHLAPKLQVLLPRVTVSDSLACHKTTACVCPVNGSGKWKCPVYTVGLWLAPHPHCRLWHLHYLCAGPTTCLPVHGPL